MRQTLDKHNFKFKHDARLKKKKYMTELWNYY